MEISQSGQEVEVGRKVARFGRSYGFYILVREALHTLGLLMGGIKGDVAHKVSEGLVLLRSSSLLGRRRWGSSRCSTATRDAGLEVRARCPALSNPSRGSMLGPGVAARTLMGAGRGQLR